MEMTVIERDDDVSLVKLSGRLDVEGMRKIDADFVGATASANRPAVVDMTGVDFISSLGIGMLFGCARALRTNGHRMVLVGPSGIVEKAMRIVGVDELIPFVDTVEEAVEIVHS